MRIEFTWKEVLDGERVVFNGWEYATNTLEFFELMNCFSYSDSLDGDRKKTTDFEIIVVEW